MSDVVDALAEAFSLNKRLAATRLVRKQELEAELDRLRGERASAAGDARPEVLALLPTLDARVATLSTELVTVEQELQAVRAELAELSRLASRQGGAAVVAALTSEDPVLRSAEAIALDNARSHLAELEAQARLGDELAGQPAPTPASAPAPSKPPSREEADAQARAEFEALRAQRQGGRGEAGEPKAGGRGAEDEASPSPAGAGPPARPKKTL